MDDPWKSKWASMYQQLGITEAQLIKDGVIDEEAYAAANPRVLFVLKEPNGWEGEDLRAVLRAKDEGWHPLARWGAGILNGFPPYATVDTPAMRRAALRRSAVINLKKQAGGSSSRSEVINAFAFLHRAILRDQIATIGPRI